MGAKMSRTRTCQILLSVAAVTLLPLCPVALGYGFHDSQSRGTLVPGFGVESIAQSGAWTTVVDGPLAALANPARIATEGGRTELAATGGYLTWKEEVHRDTTVSKRTDWLPTAMALGGGFAVSRRIDAAVSLGRVSDFDYSGQHEMPEDPFQPGATDSLEELEVSGALYEAAAGLSFDGPLGLRLGAGTGLLFGGADYEYSIVAQGEADSLARTESWSWTHTRPVGHVGMSYRGGIGRISAAYISGTPRFSPRLGASAVVLAERIGHILVGFEGELLSPLARNIFIGRYHMRIPLRRSINMLTGMSFRESPDAHRTSLGFSFGCMVRVDGVNVGLCLDWRSKDRLGSSFPSEQADHVYDSGTIIAAEISTRL
jgi:hypothetical protein